MTDIKSYISQHKDRFLDELFDLLQGANPHQIVRQIFSNQQTGQFERAAVVRFLKSLETGVAPENRAQWLSIEQQIVNERTQSKYNAMVSKGIYVTNEDAQESAVAGNKNVNFDYVSLAHSSVTDDEVTGISRTKSSSTYKCTPSIYEFIFSSK